MENPEAAGSLQGLHLIVNDIEAARDDLTRRHTVASEIFHFEEGTQVAGPGPQRADYESFLSFSDPDGNMWLVQEVRGAASAS
jgi:hypothetical protein